MDLHPISERLVALVDPVEAVSVPAPAPIRVRQPVYPQAALKRGVEGRVVLEFSLSADGGVSNLQLISSTPAGIFEKAAIDAMRGWQYALPDAAAGGRRYRQTMAFTLDSGRAGALPGPHIHARGDCQMVTGTHICRWPDEVGSQARELSAQGLQSYC